MRVGLATARALGFVTRRSRRGRGPCTGAAVEPQRAPTSAGMRSGPRKAPSSATSATTQGRMFEDFVAFRSQLGAVAVLATQLRTLCSVGGGDFSLEVEGDGDDDDGT